MQFEVRKINIGVFCFFRRTPKCNQYAAAWRNWNVYAFKHFVGFEANEYDIKAFETCLIYQIKNTHFTWIVFGTKLLRRYHSTCIWLMVKCCDVIATKMLFLSVHVGEIKININVRPFDWSQVEDRMRMVWAPQFQWIRNWSLVIENSSNT